MHRFYTRTAAKPVIPVSGEPTEGGASPLRSSCPSASPSLSASRHRVEVVSNNKYGGTRSVTPPQH